MLVAALVIGGAALAGRDLLRQRQVRFVLIEGAAVALLALGLGCSLTR